jgi:hypothetical protein
MQRSTQHPSGRRTKAGEEISQKANLRLKGITHELAAVIVRRTLSPAAAPATKPPNIVRTPGRIGSRASKRAEEE